ncbi:MAG: hypothetical protein ACK5GI_04905 [Ignavibacteria bacterium]|jgi:hypothetical protein
MIAILITLVLACATLHAQPVFDTCGMEGSAVRSDVRTLNQKKNRFDVPTDKQVNRSVDFVTLLTSREHPTSFREGDAVEITAYIEEIKLGAIESVNCGSKDPWHRDAHIELTINPMQTGVKEHLLIAEITPRLRQLMKERGVDWSQQALVDKFKGRWVKVRGWAFYDAMHDDESAGSGGSRIWRGSPWEIHPVTSIEVTTRPANLPALPAITSQSSPASQPASASRQCEGTTKTGNRCKRTVKAPARFCYQHGS